MCFLKFANDLLILSVVALLIVALLLFIYLYIYLQLSFSYSCPTFFLIGHPYPIPLLAQSIPLIVQKC